MLSPWNAAPGSDQHQALRPPTSAWQRFWRGVREPVSDDKRRRLQERWQSLPDSLRVDQQVTGRQMIYCSYTLGAAYCSFGCSHCYLPRNANRVPIPSFEEMCRQIDANRVLQGHDAALQLTGGDVLDAYWKANRADELIQVLDYAAEAGVVPMLMTHGQVLLDHPAYFERLIVEGRLRKLSIHIDLTQAGRPGFPRKELSSEADLHPLRQRFVDLVEDVRRRTGVRFSVAHTVTVTEQNLSSIGEILSWLTEDPRRSRAFNLISFQPEAAIGRTRSSQQPITPEGTWRAVCEAVGLDEHDRFNVWFGDPACSNMTLALVRPQRGDRPQQTIQLMPADRLTQRYAGRLLRLFGGVGSRGWDQARANGQRVGIVARNPWFLLETAWYALRRLAVERPSPAFLWDLARGRVALLNLVQHNFMSEDELAAGGVEVERRLHACTFRGAVEQPDGSWEAVPMCSMNGGLRERLYDHAIEQAEGSRSLPIVA